MRNPFRRVSYRTIASIALAIAAVVYLIIVPSVDAFLEQFRERPTSYVVEDLSTWEILRIRSAKLIVFSIFAYFGACVGSFLNVVAASAPRGEPIALRSSSCPKCNTPIRRVDNIPIFSYWRLKGRCRSCEAKIPIRYLAVEVIGLTIFASLFLYELVTGAANVPKFQYYPYAGILWIILYTKWPVVGIYFYHAFMFCFVLVFALMEADKLKCPKPMSLIVIGTFAALAIASPTLQTISFDYYHGSIMSESMPGWFARSLTCVVGAIAGWLIALISGRLGVKTPPTISLVLLGVALGWQALVTIALIWAIAMLAVGVWYKKQVPAWLGPSAALFAAAMVHHPAWKQLFRVWHIIL